uniref:Transmembrane serine protease 7 n=1 Tax=Monodelphis domestica TaxID=13616 RepID=A0A5F8G615_MONDO
MVVTTSANLVQQDTSDVPLAYVFPRQGAVTALMTALMKVMNFFVACSNQLVMSVPSSHRPPWSVMASGIVKMAKMRRIVLREFHATTKLLSVAMMFALKRKMPSVMELLIAQMGVMKKAVVAAGLPPLFSTASLVVLTLRKVGGLGKSASILLGLLTVVPQSSPGNGSSLQPIVSKEAGGGRLPAPADAMIQLAELRVHPEEAVPLSGRVPQENVLQVEDPEAAQARRQNSWKFCKRPVKGKYKLWMAVASLFIGFILMIIIVILIHEVTYSDEDENEIFELSFNKTFLVTLKIPEPCMAKEDSLSNELNERLRSLYSSSPALSRYFASVEIAGSSSNNSTMAYHLNFVAPSEDGLFMEYMMSKELVLGILRQNFHDQSVVGCETLGTDPASLTLS